VGGNAAREGLATDAASLFPISPDLRRHRKEKAPREVHA